MSPSKPPRMALFATAAVSFALGIAVGAWIAFEMLQDDIWVDPTRGGLTPTETSSGRTNPEIGAHLADFFLPPMPGTGCNGNVGERCDYLLCRKDSLFSTTKLKSITYSLSPAAGQVNPLPRYDVEMVVDYTDPANPYIDFTIWVTSTLGGPRTELALTCCNHDANNKTCVDPNAPTCVGSGLPYEMYAPHVPGSPIVFKNHAGAVSSYGSPRDIPFKYGLNWSDDC